MHIAILGRQPALGMAELERVYGGANVRWFSDQAALVDSDSLTVDQLGGSLKTGRVVMELSGDWRQANTKIIQHYSKAWTSFDGKITLGISAYSFNLSAREVQKTGIILKQSLKKAGVSLRLIPNTDPQLNTATSHHNKLGLAPNKVELLIVRGRDGRIVVAESTGAQNITQLARRDQGRPKRDAFVGMLPPKLAQIIINLARVQPGAKPFVSDTGQDNVPRLLDPFCGTGVILQEAALMGYAVYGTDLSEKMIRYSEDNLAWLQNTYHLQVRRRLHEGDAMTTTWQHPIASVACEAYLGQPFSAPPSPEKLDQVKRNCNHIVTEFLKNIGDQIRPGTPLCIAVPAWRDAKGNVTHLPLIKNLEQLGFVQHQFTQVRPGQLLYYREDQVVARELLVLVKA